MGGTLPSSVGGAGGSVTFMTPTLEARRRDDDDDDADDERGSPAVTHFGAGQRFERREPEGFESLAPPSIPSVISRINPLLRLASLGREEEPQRADAVERPAAHRRLDRPPLRRAASTEREADLPEEPEDSAGDEGDEGGRAGLERSASDAERKIKVSNFPQDSYWFRSQKDREDSIIETRAETIYDDRSLDRRPRRHSSRVFHVNEDDASYS